MPTTTPVQALPIPILSDVANVPLHVSNLAGALEKQLVMSFASAAARTSAIPSPVAGMFCWRTDAAVLEYYNGAAWVQPGGRLAAAVRTTAGTALGPGEAVLGVLNQVAFTLAATRRVRWEYKTFVDTPSTSTVVTTINLRRNATGNVVVVGDTRVDASRAPVPQVTNVGVSIYASGTEVLSAGTYAYGLCLSNSSGTVNLIAQTDIPSFLTVIDAGV